MQRQVEFDQAVGEHMHVDDFFDIGNSVGFGYRSGIDGVSCRAGSLAINIDPQISRKGCVIRRVIGAVHGGRPVDHGARRAGDLLGGALECEPAERFCVGVSEAVRRMTPAKLVDDVLLKQD